MSSTKRVAAYREALKQSKDKYDSYLAKERERNRIRREKMKNIIARNTVAGKQLKDEVKKYERDRKRKYRLKKKTGKQTETTLDAESPSKTAYSRPQSLGKAVSKVKRALPPSPSKKRAVVKQLIIEEMPEAKKSFCARRKLRRKTNTDNDTEHSVTKFYGRDDISRQEPGRKDVIAVKNSTTGQKEHVPKRIMLMPISEAFSLFQSEFPSVNIKKSKFFSLRPIYILPFSKMPHEVCVCRYHANMDFLLGEISNVLSDKHVPKTGKELTVAVTCDTDNYDCMNEVCETCKDNSFEWYFDDNELTKHATLRQWGNENGYLSVTERSANVKQLVEEVDKQLGHYKKHVFVKRAQSSYFESCKNNLTDSEAVLQIDFAENASLVHQDEIQSAHWKHQQLTIFTAVAWLPETGPASFAVVSDEMQHGKEAVWVFMRAVLLKIKEQCPQVKCVKIFSDGAASQFKNKFTLSNLLFFGEDFQLTAEWNFFATSHGKGAVDGVGGKLKHSVWLAVKSRRYVVNSLKSFVACAQENVKNIHVIMMPADEVSEFTSKLETRWTGSVPIPNLQNVHHVATREGNVLLVSQTATSSTTNQVMSISLPRHSSRPVAQQSTTSVTTTGDFVLVTLKGDGKYAQERRYYAEVINESDEHVHLKFMHPSGKNLWIWPDNVDESFEPLSVIVRVVEPPVVVNSRGHFRFK